MIKRSLAFFLALCLLVTAAEPLSLTALAAEDSEWILAEDLPEGAEITDTKWTYTKTTNVDSRETSLSGYTLLSSEWVASATGSSLYASFPAGYDTTNTYYSSMRKSAYTPSETATYKRTVTNTKEGYIYWHWMYNTSSASAGNRTIYDKKGTASYNNYYYYIFGAFKSTSEFTATGNTSYSCGTNGYKTYYGTGRTSYSESQGSKYWYRFTYYTTAYTDYYKLFHYRKVENLESTEEVTAGTTTDGSYTYINSNVKKYVKYVETFSVTYDASDGTDAPAAQTKRFGEDLVLSSSVPTREGYTFLHWTTGDGDDAVTYQPGDTYTIDEDLTLYAEWEPLLYTITYHIDADDPVPFTQTKQHGVDVKLNNSILLTGKVLLGWSTQPNATAPTYSPGESYSANQSVELYAVWGDPNGECGPTATWNFSTVTGDNGDVGTLRVTGYGPTWDYQTESPWPDIVTIVDAISVAEGITEIGDFLFSGLRTSGGSEMTVSLPSSLTSLGTGAFMECISLKSITIPGGVTALPEQLFENCTALTTVSIPAGVTTVEAMAFHQCQALKKLTLPDTVTQLGAGAFMGCSQLESVNIPAGVTALPEDLFNACVSLRTFTVPDTVTSIGAGAFANCTSLTTVTIPTGVTSISEGAFTGSDNVTIRCYVNSAAHLYAEENAIPYELILLEQLAAPVITMEDRYGEALLTITAPADVTVHYTTDGSDPTEESPVYEAPITVSGSLSIRARCLKEGYTPSDIVSYNAMAVHVASPIADTADGAKLAAGTSVGFSCETEGAEIWYSTNGYPPEEGNPGRKLYTGPIVLNTAGDNIIYVMATKEGWLPSYAAQYTYHVAEVIPVPVVKSTSLDTVGTSSATITARFESSSPIQQVEICWYAKDNSDVLWNLVINTAGAASVSQVITGLDPGTVYNYYVRALNAWGWGVGDIGTFVTKDAVVADMQVTLDYGYIETYVGRSTPLLAKIRPSTAQSWIDWESADPRVAKVDANGKVTGVTPGTTTITATISNGKAAHCLVTVYPQGPEGDKNFSEKHMMTHATYYDPYGVDSSPLGGGNALMATAYLARWGGTVYEQDDPYPSDASGFQYATVDGADLHVQSVSLLPYRSYSGSSRSDLMEDIAAIKVAIHQYGAVYTSFYEDPSYYEDGGSGGEYFYYNRKDVPTSQFFHAVAIVGWDDNVSKYSFGSVNGVIPNGNGAFICKDSRGTDAHGDGYFYVSYYDTTLGFGRNNDYNAVFYNLQDTESYNKIYQHDYLGPTHLYETGSERIYLANVFTVSGSQSEELKAVSFYNYAPGTSYRVYVVQNYQGTDSFARLGDGLVAAGVRSYTGYDTVELEKGITLAAGSQFAVVVELTGDEKVFLEAPKAGYSSKAAAQAGQSFIKLGTRAWKDVHTDLLANANVCVKAFTKSGDTQTLLFGTEDPALMGLWWETEPSGSENAAELLAYSGSGALSPFIEIPGLQKGSEAVKGVKNLPKRYDLRDSDIKGVTPVRDQGSFPGCWSFAAYASLESATLLAGDRRNNNNMSGAAEGTQSLVLNLSEATVEIGDRIQLLATASHTDTTGVFISYAAEQIIWESSSPAVSVSSRGFVTALSEGVATVTARTLDGTAFAECIVTVSKLPASTDVSITNAVSTLTLGDAMRLRCSTDPGNAGSSAVIKASAVWSSSDPSVAAVDQSGYLQAVGYGYATITVTLGNGASDSFVIFVDDGRVFHAEITSENLTLSGGAVTGDMTLKLYNFGTAAENLQVCLAFYTEEGQLLEALTQNTSLYAGSRQMTFEDLKVSVPAGTGVKYRLMLYRPTECIPLIPAEDGTV